MIVSKRDGFPRYGGYITTVNTDLQEVWYFSKQYSQTENAKQTNCDIVIRWKFRLGWKSHLVLGIILKNEILLKAVLHFFCIRLYLIQYCVPEETWFYIDRTIASCNWKHQWKRHLWTEILAIFSTRQNVFESSSVESICNVILSTCIDVRKSCTILPPLVYVSICICVLVYFYLCTFVLVFL